MRRTVSTSTSPRTAPRGQTAAELDIDRLQAWLDDHGLEQIQIREQVNDWLESLSAGEISGYAQDAISFAQGAAFSFVAAAVLGDPDRRHLDLHAPRHAAPRAVDRLALPAARRRAADAADRERAVGLPQGAGDPFDGHRDERRRRHVHPRRHGARGGGAGVRAPLRPVDGLRRGGPVHRPVAVGRPAGDLRAVRRPAVGRSLGRPPLPLHLPGGGAHRRSERDGERATAPPAARHLRAARRRRAVRDRGCARRAADDGRSGRAIWEFFRERVQLESWDEDGGEVPVEVDIEPPRAASGSG